MLRYQSGLAIKACQWRRRDRIMKIAIDDPAKPDVYALLQEHLKSMFALSPPESVHALDVSALKQDGISFWTIRDGSQLLGCGA